MCGWGDGKVMVVGVFVFLVPGGGSVGIVFLLLIGLDSRSRSCSLKRTSTAKQTRTYIPAGFLTKSPQNAVKAKGEFSRW